MKKILRSALVGAMVGTIGLSACDRGQPPATVNPPAASEAVPPGAAAPADAVQTKLAEIARDPSSFSRARKLGELLPTLGPDAVPAVRNALQDRMVDLDVVSIDLLVRFWATHQPLEAAEWAKSKSPSVYRQDALYAAIYTWASQDPQAAASATWNWVDNTENEVSVPTGLARGWYTRNDDTGLRRFLRSRPPGFPGQRAIASYVRLMIQNHRSQELRTWAESRPDDDEGFKLTVFRRSVLTLANMYDEGKAEARSWCQAHCETPLGKAMRSLIARAWVVDDGPGTFKWLSEAPAGYERDVAVRGAFGVWAELDREPAMRWMAEQTAGTPPPWLEPAFLIYARVLAKDKPAEAMKWASQIKGPQDREETEIIVARIWRGSDEAAAEQWLLQSPLSEEARNKARQPVDPSETW
jgi:hypothetical protein